jgi:transcriptional regulator with XRE-family HTH domain
MEEKTKYHTLTRLGEWRKERRLTQEELARASGVGRTTIAALETGKRRAYSSTARKLAKVLKVKPEALA